METWNRIAAACAAAGGLFALGSTVLPDAKLAAGAATAGLVLSAAAAHTARPRRIGPVRGGALALGAFAATAIGFLALLATAAVLARTGAFLFLGAVSAFLAEHFTLVTGPVTILLCAAAFGGAIGAFAPARRAPEWRRAVTVPATALLAVVAGLTASGAVLPGEPWHAPYYVAFALFFLYADAVWRLGLPTPRAVGDALEQSEGKERYKRLVSAAAYAGNGLAAVLAAGSAVAAASGDEPAAAGLLLATLVVLVAATHAVSIHRKLTPLALEPDPELARFQMVKMRVMGGGLVAGAFLAVVGAFLALLALGNPRGALAGIASLWPYVAGPLLLLGAVLNIARARLPSRVPYSNARKAGSSVLLGWVFATAFFGQLQSQSLIDGPIVQETMAPALHLAATASVMLYALVRGLYPSPMAMPSRLAARMNAPKAPQSAEELQARMQRNMVFVYVFSGLFVMAAVGALFAMSLGVIARPQVGAPQGNAAFFALLALGLVTLGGLGAVFLQSRRVASLGPAPLRFKRRKTTSEVIRFTALGLSITVSIILATMGTLIWTGQLTSLGAIELPKKLSTDFLVFALLVGLGPAGFLYNRERSRIRAIDERLPDLLRDLAESQRSGMTLTQAVITSAKGNYGALTPEIKKMATQIEWGISFEEAFIRFATRVQTPLVQRSVSLIVQASKAGGNVVDVLTAASDDARELYQIQTERRRSMSTYVIIIYVAFFVFLSVVGVLNAQFMPNVARAVEGAKGAQLGSISFKPFDLEAFKTVFFHASIVQAFGGGFVAGAMETGRPVGGLRHAFIMTILAYVAFRFVIGG